MFPAGAFNSLLDLSPEALIGVGVAVVLAAMLRGFTGFGFALIAVPLTSMVLPPSRSVPMVFTLQLMIGAIDTLRHFRNCDRSIFAVAIFAVATTPIGVYLLSIASPDIARLTIAVMMLVGAVALWRPMNLKIRPGHMLGAVAGIGVGLSNGLAAMPGPPAIAYSLLTELPVNRARVSLMVLFFLTALAGLPSALAFGIADTTTFVLAIAAFPLILAGTFGGELLFRHFGTSAYRQVALLTLIGTALAMIGRELLAMTSWG